MSANNSKVQSVIENTFTSVIKELTKNESAGLISDLFVQVDAENGELQIFDEEENMLGKVVIFDWVNNNDKPEVFNKKTASVVKAVLTILTTKNMFEHSRFLKPFSVSLVDDDFSVIEELLFIDDDTFRLDDPLLKDLDAELDDFLKDLLSDMPK
ncbi:MULTISPECIES: hypothetical protein [unclassified Parabacteroides]|uniref:hypothetical protein n=1 Tax=unclassified Parabacteroides TaxID=2649774 RepID=UPI0024742CC1|nr:MULTISPECIES: hypothetical protein [unclassified Parabacteroides]